MRTKLGIWNRSKKVDETKAIRLDHVPPGGTPEEESTPTKLYPPTVGQGRTHRLTFSSTKAEARLFKRKAKEVNTSLSALVRTALYAYLQIDPPQ